MKRVYLFFVVACSFFGALATSALAAEKPFVVVIDAGHGGHDPGALGAIAQEKTLNLDVSKLLGKMILDEYKDVTVYFTRATDVFLTLQERADFVNKKKADLFISIHTNSSDVRSVKGAETYTLGIDKLQSNLDIAKRENSVILLEDNYKITYQGFDPKSDESYIMFEFMQNQYLDQSVQYAWCIQKQFTTNHRSDRGVRQAGFWVLHKAACPSVLIEMGFISNPEEERYLASSNGKNEVATSIFSAFKEYKNALDKKTAIQVPKGDESNTPVEAVSTVPTNVEVANVPADQPSQMTVVAQTSAESMPTKLLDQVAETPQPQPILSDPQPAQSVGAAPKTIKPTGGQPVFRVQIFSVQKVLPLDDETFQGMKDCQYSRAETPKGVFYRYTYGEETNYEIIKLLRDNLRKLFPDCFIVAFLDGKQIAVQQALQMIGQ